MISDKTTITVGAIALVITLGINVYNFFNARIKEAKQKGEEKGVIVTKLEEILKKVDLLTASNERIDKTTHDLAHMVADHEARIKRLEKKRLKIEEIDE